MASIGITREEFFSQLEVTGEENVRHNLNPGIYSNSKRQLVEAWLA
jgi:hypothetical protein